MHFCIPFIGKTKEQYLAAGIDDYSKRLSRFASVDLVVLKEKNYRNTPGEVIKKTEASQLLEKARPHSLILALDPKGKQCTSEELAELITGWENRGLHSVCLLIGGHLGLSRDVIDRADLVLSLSALTFTHEMTRLILLEQLYRACTIKAGHNYHK